MTAGGFAATPEPPYYAVIFSSLRRAGDGGYEAMAARMVELAARQPGFLGMESARGADGFGITVSYWASEADIKAWRDDFEHRFTDAGPFMDWRAEAAQRYALASAASLKGPEQADKVKQNYLLAFGYGHFRAARSLTEYFMEKGTLTEGDNLALCKNMLAQMCLCSPSPFRPDTLPGPDEQALLELLLAEHQVVPSSLGAGELALLRACYVNPVPELRKRGVPATLAPVQVKAELLAAMYARTIRTLEQVKGDDPARP